MSVINHTELIAVDALEDTLVKLSDQGWQLVAAAREDSQVFTTADLAKQQPAETNPVVQYRCFFILQKL